MQFIIKSGFKSRAGYHGVRTIHIPAYIHRYLKYRVLLCGGVSFCLYYCHAPRFYFIVVVNASAKIAGTPGPSELDRVLPRI